MYILYGFPVSQHSRRVAALLDEAGIDYDHRIVDLAAGEQRAPDYLVINPNHQVPALIDGDLSLSESNAILRYICNSEKLTDWYPADLSRRALCDQWLDWNQCRLGPVVKDIVFNKVFMGAKGDQAVIARDEAALPDVLGILDAGLAGRDFLLGPMPTIADLSVGSNITHLGLAGVIPDQANIKRWIDRVCAIGGFRKNLPQR